MSATTDVSEAIIERIKLLRPYAKFISVSDSRDFVPNDSVPITQFFVVHLYDERVDANFLTTKLGSVLILNGYLSSFAYNIVLCWLYGHREHLPKDETERLLRYNFRKFLAEQTYRANNCIRSRELLLRTLLFEQAEMEAVIAYYRSDIGLSGLAASVSGLMDHILTMHELGHFFLKAYPAMWEQVTDASSTDLRDIIAPIWVSCPPELASEFQSDVYAVIGCLIAYEKELGALMVLRGLVFAYAAYAVMYSAASTALATAATWAPGNTEEVDFSDISPLPNDDFALEWQFDSAFVRRAHLVKELCDGIAAKRGLSLIGTDGPFPLPDDIVGTLMEHLGFVLVSESETSVKIARVVSRSLHGHERGMEYLYLRSKIFRSARPNPLIV